MQTISVQIKDSYVSQFMNYVQEHNDNIVIAKDKNLEYDPYFYERQRELKQIIKECENGTMELLSQEQYDDEMKIFFKDLKANADIQN
jgi:5,10-methylenetetrahydrofolate reductase